jgi:hypothetical protein
VSPESDLCPFCGAQDIELVSLWGGQLITSLVRCQSCNTHFEAIRDTCGPAQPLAVPDEGVPRTQPASR